MKRKWNILDNSFKKAFCILLSLAIFAGVTPISAFALETEPVSVSTWQQLQEALGVGGVINLENDITADAQDTALLATAQCQLNLNGHTINRNLSSPVAGGSVIVVYDELTLSGSGTITGGYTSSYGGGVYVETNGSFVLDGATISGNRVNGANNKCGGGGVSINTKGCFRMESGEITNNTVGSANGNQGGGVRIGNGTFVMNGGAIYGNTSSGQGAGVYVLNTSVFTVSGSASVTSNTKDSKQNNIYFAGQATMTADSSLEASARFSVSSKQSNGDIINLKNPDRISCFVSDSNAYVVALSGTNKAKLVTNSFNVTVDTNISHGSVITDKSKPGAGETVTVTAIPDEGYLLDEITVTDSNGENVAVNSNTFVMPKSSVTVSATFGIAREYFLFEDSNIQNGHILIENNRVLAGQQVTVMTDGDSGRVTTSLTARYYDEWEHEYINEVADISHPDPNTITFTMPSADVNIYATFSEYNQQRVFVCDMQGGTVLLNKTAAYEGENITLTIRPDNGYAYDEGSLSVQVDLGNSTMMDIYDLVEMEKDSIYSFDMPYYTVYINATFSKAPEQPKYAVVVEDDELDNGTVETDLYEASAGWTVTVTAKPDTRLAYELESLTVIDRDGNEYDITPIGNNKYTFLMPAKEVFVSAVFDIPDHQVTAQSVDVDMPEGVSTGCELNVDYPDARTGENVTAWFSLRYKTTLVDISVTGDETGNSYPITLSLHSNSSYFYAYEFTMPNESVTVTARFTLERNSVQIDCNGENTTVVYVNGQSSQTAREGDTINVTTTLPDDRTAVLEMYYSYINEFGNEIPKKTIEFTKQGQTYTASFSMPDGDTVVHIVVGAPYCVNISDGQYGNLQISTDLKRAAQGDIVTAWVPYYNGSTAVDWEIKYVDKNGQIKSLSFSAVQGYEQSFRYITFTMPDADVFISMSFGLEYVKRSRNGSDIITETVKLNYEHTLISAASSTLKDGWYVLDGNKTFSQRLVISGDVNIILCDDMTLTCEKGIELSASNTLTVYGQKNETGQIIATADDYCAGIGGSDGVSGGHLIINGATINSTGGDFGAGIGSGDEASLAGRLTMFGGTVTARGGDEAAGVGGGNEVGGGVVNIYGGTLEARGSSLGAGIGGGDEADGGTFTIWGGKVTAVGGSDAAGIGGGEGGHQGGTVTVNGGIVTAEGYYGAGVGGGEDGNGGTVTINGGKLTARGHEEAAGIGGGQEGNGGTVTINGGTVHAYGYKQGAGIGGGYKGLGGIVTINDGTVVGKCISFPSRGAGIGGGANCNQNGEITINGGKVTASSVKGAGIGGGFEGDAGTINIKGGLVTTKSEDGAGIGGGGCIDIGDGGFGGNITIENAVVIAVSTKQGAGIGGGEDGNCGTVTIKSGHVTATGGYFDYDLWQDYMSPDYTAFFKSGIPDYKKAVASFILDLIFSGEYGGAGIGGGDDGDGGTVNITGGTVIASAGLNTASAIGHGNDSSVNGTLNLYDEAKVSYGYVSDSGEVIEGKAPANQRGSFAIEKSVAVIEPCDHSQSAFIKTSSTHLQTCSYCLTHFDAEEHKWDEGEVTTAPTIDSTGVMTFNCEVCGQKKEESIETLELVTQLKTANAIASYDGSTITLSPKAQEENICLYPTLKDGTVMTFSSPTGGVKISKYSTLYAKSYGTATALINGKEYTVLFDMNQKPEETVADLIKTANATVTSDGNIITLTPIDPSAQINVYPSAKDGSSVTFKNIKNAKLSKSGTLYAKHAAMATAVIGGEEYEIIFDISQTDMSIEKIIKTANATVSVEETTVTLLAKDTSSQINLYPTTLDGKTAEFSEIVNAKVSKAGTCYAKSDASCKMTVGEKVYDVIFAF